MATVTVAGRQELTAQVVAQLGDGGRVLLVGDAGMGKSTLLRSIAATIRQRPGLSLSASPVETDARMPFVTLIDLFANVPADHFERLPAATLRVVEFALRRRDPVGQPLDTLGVCLGMLDLLRLMTEATPVTLVVDDLQWVDQASAEVLAFVLRRLGTGRLSVLAALRSGETPRLLLPDAVSLPVGPLPMDALVPVVMARAGGLVGRQIAQRICALSGGNPLFALEIAAAVGRSGVRPVPGQPLPVPVHLDTLMRQRLALLPATARDTVRMAATAYRPTLTLLDQAGCHAAVADLTAASEAGICDLDSSGRVAFGHPLLRAAVYAEAPVIVRMAMHARLAQVSTDPIDLARHLALATGQEDETVASALTTAAELAGRRGASGVARELIGLAALRTPATDRSGWATRKLAEARFAYQGGLLSEAREAAGAVLAAEVSRPLRTAAWMAVLQASGDAIGQMGDQVAAACAEAEAGGEPQPWVRVYAAVHHAAALRLDVALADATWAARAAVDAGDVRAELRALHVVLRVKARLGQPCDEEADRARRLLAGRTDLGEVALLIHHELAWSHYDADRYDEAYAELRTAVRLAEDCGTVIGLELVLHLLARVQRRRGQGTPALATVARLQQLAADVEPASANLVSWALAESEAATGSSPRAFELAEQVIAATQRAGDLDKLAQFCQQFGAWRLVAGDPASAVTDLHRAHLLVRDLPIGNQTRLLLADLVEAHAATGDLAQARGLLAELHGADAPPASALAVAARQRAEAVLAFAEGRAAEAADLLSSAAERCRVLGVPAELYRVLLLAAGIERRRRRRGAARALLAEAAEACRAAGVTTGVAQIDRELARLVPGQNRRDTSLTPMEERIVALVVRGATNREVARDLSIAVTTVEGSLTKIYRQFQIRSRVELVRAFELIDSGVV
ncbi:AAA family ATPase [Micromonospora peucetia]|uniref:helix-turn-helix transcriptional regulator n=1 Tax=Micromonospora peucetia TaxID=47871 RepID=UPI00332908E0